MMGHMDDDSDKHTIRILTPQYEQTFHECTEVVANEDQLDFTDKGGKHHQFHGVSYHITQD